MKGMISLWTGTPMFRHSRGQLMVMTLSHCLALQAFDVVEFVTDFHGVELAERMGWRFTSIVPALECLNTCNTKHIWALGKLVALREQRKPVCQLDYDVYLHKQLPLRMREARLIAQSVDWPQFYLGERMETAIGIAGLPSGHVAYNAGLLGGADAMLVHDYAVASLELAQKFAGREDEIDEGTTISMVIEQYHLGVFARENDVRIETILPLNPTREEWREAGYTHLHGKAKRDPYYLKNTARRLKEQFPSAFAAFEAGWQELHEDLFP
jgi:hypothetical protein